MNNYFDLANVKCWADKALAQPTAEEAAKSAINRVDSNFESIGVTSGTTTRIPGNR